MSRSKAVSNPELEAAILQDPDAVDAYLVYGDWLQSQGDPRGELISLHHARGQARGPEAESFEQQAHEFLRQHESRLVGDVLAQALRHKVLELDWDLGFIRAARVSQNSYTPKVDVQQTVQELLHHPSGRFLRELSVGVVSLGGWSDRYDAVTRLIVQAGGSRTLQALAFHAEEHNEHYYRPSIQLHDISPLYAVLPRLRTIKLRGRLAGLGDVNLPELREFTLRASGISRDCLDSVANANWPMLEHMELWLGGNDINEAPRAKDLQFLLDGKGLPKLRHLGLCNTQFTDELISAFRDSRVLPRLTHLDLSGGTLSNQGAKWLSENTESFQHLQHLDLRRNTMTDVGVAQVAAVCPSVNAKKQRNR